MTVLLPTVSQCDSHPLTPSKKGAESTEVTRETGVASSPGQAYCSSANSQDFANVQRRSAVAKEIPRTVAASGIVSPPK